MLCHAMPGSQSESLRHCSPDERCNSLSGFPALWIEEESEVEVDASRPPVETVDAVEPTRIMRRAHGLPVRSQSFNNEQHIPKKAKEPVKRIYGVRMEMSAKTLTTMAAATALRRRKNQEATLTQNQRKV